MRTAGIVVITLALVFSGGVFAAQPPAPRRPAPPTQDTTVSGVTLTIAPVPNVGQGAPMLTVNEIDEIRARTERQLRESRSNARECGGSIGQFTMDGPPSPVMLYQQEYLASVRVADVGKRAADASAAATKARLDIIKGDISQQQVDDAELARQRAVNEFSAARAALIDAKAMTRDYFNLRGILKGTGDTVSWADLMGASEQRMKTGGLEGVPLSVNYASLELVNVRAVQVSGRAGVFMHVTGEIRNSRDRAVAIPPLAIAAVDHAGFSLKTEKTVPPRSGRIPAHGSVKFAYDFRPKPPLAKTVVVAFSDWEMQIVEMPAGFYCGGPG